MSKQIKFLFTWLVPAALVGALFAWGRFVLVEPAAMIAACEGNTTRGICFWRQMVIEVFVHQRIGWFALATGLAATVLRWSWLASLAALAGVTAILLYSAELGAGGVLLGLLVLARNAGANRVANASATTVNANQAD
jgi:hypothetical protein